jgi:hypothetical protein
MTTQQLMSDRLRLVPVTVETCIAELEKYTEIVRPAGCRYPRVLASATGD